MEHKVICTIRNEVSMSLRIADSARLYGTIHHGDGVYIAQGTILRSHHDSLRIGNQSWVLENSVIIGTEAHPMTIGSKTIFGHRCLAIGASIGDLCEIGNSTIFLPGSTIGSWCIFGEGTIIPSGMTIPDECVVVGRPGRIIRRLTPQDKAMIARMRGENIDLGERIDAILHNPLKEEDRMGKLYPLNDKYPQVDESTVIYDTAEISGDVVIGKNSIIGAGVRIIGDSHGPVIIGDNVHILENCVLHLLPDNRLVIEDDVTIGPGCMIHGTTIGRGSVIESGAIVCDYSVLGKNIRVTAGTLVKQRSQFDDDQILEGFPACSIGTNDKPLLRPDWGFRT